MRHLDAQTSVTAVVRAAQRAGRSVSLVKGGADKEATLASFADALGFPDYFGHNLDALYDCLGDLADEQAARGSGEWEIVWDDAAELRAADPETYASILEILGEVESDHDGLSIAIIER
ncbi:MAG: barstar family protein [Micrococcales bacterium]|nr:barstar family protein [Micrococcales bacterium]